MAQEGYVHKEFPKYVHHPEHAQPSRLVLDEEAEAAVLESWGISKDDADTAVDSIRGHLLERAATLNIDVNPRWSDKRLQMAVDEAAAAAKAAAPKKSPFDATKEGL